MGPAVTQLAKLMQAKLGRMKLVADIGLVPGNFIMLNRNLDQIFQVANASKDGKSIQFNTFTNKLFNAGVDVTALYQSKLSAFVADGTHVVTVDDPDAFKVKDMVVVGEDFYKFFARVETIQGNKLVLSRSASYDIPAGSRVLLWRSTVSSLAQPRPSNTKQITLTNHMGLVVGDLLTMGTCLDIGGTEWVSKVIGVQPEGKSVLLQEVYNYPGVADPGNPASTRVALYAPAHGMGKLMGK